MRYDVILFDMDGTVVDSLQDMADATNATMRHFSLPPRSRDEVRRFVGNGARRLIELSAPEETEERIDEILSWYLPYYGAHCRDKTRPYEGIPELLRTLRAKGLRLAVISNKPDPALQGIAEEFFAGLFDLAVGETAQVRRKPWPDLIDVSVEKLGAEKARCLYVGDSEVDVQTARNAGIDCVSVSWGFRSREELEAAGAERIIDRPEDLLACLD